MEKLEKSYMKSGQNKMEDLEKEYKAYEEWKVGIGDTVVVSTIFGDYTGTVIDIDSPDESVGIFGTSFLIEDRYKIADSYYNVQEHFSPDMNYMYYNIIAETGTISGRIVKVNHSN